jgi:hypothetical protein
METFVLFVLAGLQAKHFIADYLLQSRWMIAGKASFAKPGGYAHVAVHVLGSLLVLMLAGVSAAMIAGLIVADDAPKKLMEALPDFATLVKA